jgi:Ferritin-like
MARDWDALILRVAHEEMAISGMDTNLLAAVGRTPHCGGPNFPLLRRYFRTDQPLDVGGTRFMIFTLTSFPSPGAALIGDRLACRVSELATFSAAPCCYCCSCSTAWS